MNCPCGGSGWIGHERCPACDNLVAMIETEEWVFWQYEDPSNEVVE